MEYLSLEVNHLLMRLFVTLKAIIDSTPTTGAFCIYDTEASDLRQAGHVFNSPASCIASKIDLHRDAHLQHHLGSVGEVRLVPRYTSSGKAAAKITRL